MDAKSVKMKYIIFFVVIMTTSMVHSQSIVKSFTFDSNSRSYRIFIPSGYNPGIKYPLVLNLHGNGSTAEEQEAYSEMNLIADTANFIVVYPDGIINTWNSGFNIPYHSGTDDIGFISALIDTVAANYNIDLLRIYSCGMSMGGFMSYRLACELHHRIAAIASVTGLMSNQIEPNCQQQKKVPVLQIHGTHDSTVYYTGNFYHTSVDYTIEWWKQKNACPASPVVTNIPDTVNEGSSVIKYYYGLCGNSSEVVLYKIDGGGHTWPGGMPIPSLGNTNRDINASVEIWEFFKKHALGSTTSVNFFDKEESMSIMAVPNPVEEKLTLIFEKNSKGSKRIAVYNFTGEMIYYEIIPSSVSSATINFTSETAGLYFISASDNQATSVIKVMKE